MEQIIENSDRDLDELLANAEKTLKNLMEPQVITEPKNISEEITKSELQENDEELEEILHELSLSHIAMDKDYEEIRTTSKNIDRILESLEN